MASVSIEAMRFDVGRAFMAQVAAYMRHLILTAIAVGHCSLALVTTCRAGPSPIPPIQLIAQAERILLVQAGESEQSSGGEGTVSIRTPLHVLWDLTHTAGKEQEPTFADKELSIEWVGRSVVVESTGRRLVSFRIPYPFLKDEIAVVYLQRILDDSTRERVSAFVGEWKVIEKRRCSPIRIVYVDPPLPGVGGMAMTALPMRSNDWEALVVHAADVLTLLGIDPGQAFLIAREQVQALQSQEGTTIHGLTWGEVKWRFRP